MIRTQIIMLRMRSIFVSLILIFERNKIFFIIEFIYYKFNVIIIIIIFFFFCWFFKTWLFLSILLFLLDQSRLIDSLSFNFGIRNELQQFNRYKRTTFCHLLNLFNSSFFCLASDYVFSNDRIKSSRAFISWFCNTLLCSSFFAPESRWMKALIDLAFTLNILAATALLSVRFSLKNFFAFFISTVMMMKMESILTRKRDLFWSEKKIDNQSENQITAMITITNEVSEDLWHRIFMRWVIWINFSQISDDFQWWWWW